jgi:hypothetical protein
MPTWFQSNFQMIIITLFVPLSRLTALLLLSLWVSASLEPAVTAKDETLSGESSSLVSVMADNFLTLGGTDWYQGRIKGFVDPRHFSSLGLF